MQLNKVELHCLNSLTDDYENVSSIEPDITRALKRDIRSKELENCLTGLIQRGLVEVYDFDPVKSQYIASALRPGDIRKQWFFVSEVGREQLDRNWGE
jgi:hypothetical protein